MTNEALKNEVIRDQQKIIESFEELVKAIKVELNNIEVANENIKYKIKDFEEEQSKWKKS